MHIMDAKSESVLVDLVAREGGKSISNTCELIGNIQLAITMSMITTTLLQAQELVYD